MENALGEKRTFIILFYNIEGWKEGLRRRGKNLGVLRMWDLRRDVCGIKEVLNVSEGTILGFLLTRYKKSLNRREVEGWLESTRSTEFVMQIVDIFLIGGKIKYSLAGKVQVVLYVEKQTCITGKAVMRAFYAGRSTHSQGKPQQGPLSLLLIITTLAFVEPVLTPTSL